MLRISYQDEEPLLDWFLTADASSREYRYALTTHDSSSTEYLTIQRYYVELPRKNMLDEDVDDWVQKVMDDAELRNDYSMLLDQQFNRKALKP